MRATQKTIYGLGFGLPMVVAGPVAAAQQIPLPPRSATGLTVTPAFEGWYENGDGTYSLSFGYYNRNSDEIIEIPVGSDNMLGSVGLLQNQPTRFEEGRHWGTFAVRVPGEWAVGKVGEVFPADAGKLMMPGSQITWEVHLHAMGEEVRAQVVELGVYFYPEGYVPQNRTVLNLFQVVNGELDIPPGQVSVTQNFVVLQAPARLENFQPHMHMRGKAMSMEAIYPDGRKELLSSVDNFQWNWHNNYVYTEDAAPLLPKGTTLVFTAWHDNTEANPNNPDFRQWVGYGDRTVDEMAHAWVDVTYLEQEEFDRQVAARADRPAADRQDDNQ